MQEAVISPTVIEEPKFPGMISIGTLLVICFSAIGSLVFVAILSAPACAPVRWLIGPVLAECVVKIVLAVFTRQGKVWAYYTLLVVICLGIIVMQITTGKPQVMPFLLFVMLVSNYKAYHTYAEYKYGAMQAVSSRSLNA